MAEYRAPIALTIAALAIAIAPILRPTLKSEPPEKILVPAKIARPEPYDGWEEIDWSSTFPSGPPQVMHASDNGRFLTLLDIERHTLTLKELGRPLWTIKWPQAAPPIETLIANDGRRVVLVGYESKGWHGDEGGDGREFVLLGEGGRILAAYRAHDITMDGLETANYGFECGGETLGLESPTLRLDPSQRHVLFLRSGVKHSFCYPMDPRWLVPISIRLSDGAQMALSEDAKEAIVAPYRDRIRAELEDPKSKDRFSAVLTVAELSDRQSIPALVQIIEGPYDGTQDTADLHLYAARSLAQILGPGANAFINQRIKTRAHAQNWRRALKAANSELISLLIHPDSQALEDPAPEPSPR